MRVRFLTTFADGPFGYAEGAILDLPDPIPNRFLRYLKTGLLEAVRSEDDELALAPVAVEQAIARRRMPVRRRGRRKAVATAQSADGEP